MMYIENIFICISIPLLLSLIFIQGEARKYTLFVCIGIMSFSAPKILFSLSALIIFTFGHLLNDAILAIAHSRASSKSNSQSHGIDCTHRKAPAPFERD